MAGREVAVTATATASITNVSLTDAASALRSLLKVGPKPELESLSADNDFEPLELETIGAPTLVLWGDADEWISADVSHQLVATLPVSRRIELPGIARLAPEEAPERLAQLVLAMVSAAQATVRGELPVEPMAGTATATGDPADAANAGTVPAHDAFGATELRDANVV